MIPVTMQNPIKSYEPLAIFNLKLLPEVSEIKLLVKARYCDLNTNLGVAYFYAELTDGSNSFILPVRYYEWLALQDAKYVFCQYQKIRRGKTFLNVLELKKIPGTFLSFADNAEEVKPLQNGNIKLQSDYVILHKEIIDVTRVLQKQSDILYYGLATGNLKNNLYVQAYTRAKDLFSIGQVGIQYRYLNINQRIITDLEVFIGEI